jgi:TDG/mug DNA glycosylase family protein
MTGVTGYAYAHPTNQFWKLLYSSGITAQLHPPSDTYKLPELYNIGNTNIVERPTRDASMLSKQEMLDGVPILEAKIREKKPQAVCLVGKGIWEAVFRVKCGRPLRKEDFKHGWQESFFNMGRDPSDPGWDGTPVFVATTTSGLSTNLTFEQKKAIWAELGQWVKERREAQINASNHDLNQVPNHGPNDLLDHDLDNGSCGIESGITHEAC